MLRITNQTSADSHCLRLEGSLKGPWVDELEKAWATLAKTAHGLKKTVDLRSLSFVDSAGVDLLLRIRQEGAVLEDASAFVICILEHKIEESQNLENRSMR